MARLIHASLTIIAAIAVTALIMSLVLPVHARSSAQQTSESSDIVRAVLVNHSGVTSDGASCPALPQPNAGSSCPYLAGKSGQTEGAASDCPYLAKQDARSDCPALKERSERSGDTPCPYLSGQGRHETDSPQLEDESAPVTLTL
jgi:hypothetical protein